MPVLWIPACPECKTPNQELVYLPGTDQGPQDPARIYAHWNCPSCTKRVYLPRSAWVRVGSIDGGA